MTLDEIIVRYQLEEYSFFKVTDIDGKKINQRFIFDSHNDYLSKYLDFYKNLDNVTELIVYAVNGFFKVTKNGFQFFIQHGHQTEFKDSNGNLRGISSKILKEVSERLIMNIDAVKAVKDFSEVIEVVNNARVKGFGELAIYDTSVRIGSYLNIEPENVFLHRGAREGCFELEKKGYIEIGLSDRPFIEMAQLPVQLQSMKPLSLEHFFVLLRRI